MKAAAHSSLFLLLVGSAVTLAPRVADAQVGSNSRVPQRTAQRSTAPPTTRQAISPAAPAGGAVAVVDISYIFKNHAGFKATMEDMKKEVQAYEEELRARHQALQKEKDQLSQFRPGSPDYERLERALAEKVGKLQIDTQMKKKEFLQRESKVYFQVYQEVSAAVRDFAEQKRIDLVLRYNGDQIDPDDRASVLQGVNRALVYHRNLDITREILDRLNRAPRAARNPARPTR